MSNKSKKIDRHIRIAADPRGHRKEVGGADHDDWNDWLALTTSLALPVDQNDETGAVRATTAVYSGMIDLKPADPIEGILISQLMAASQASLSMYQQGWAQPPEYLEARLRYLALADKAARTVVLLTERLDQHRGRGQQQIVVKHVTVNADQALVTDTVVTGKPAGNVVPSPALLTDTADKPMPALDETSKLAPVGGTKKK
jgi:hypothetical protein